jgi:hypothetical protein
MVEGVATIGLEDAARFLHMAPSTLRKRAAAGKLDAYKPGRTWVTVKRPAGKSLASH